jgi:hypothetical protein
LKAKLASQLYDHICITFKDGSWLADGVQVDAVLLVWLVLLLATSAAGTGAASMTTSVAAAAGCALMAPAAAGTASVLICSGPRVPAKHHKTEL